MPAPTAPVNITVTLGQNEIDAIWAVVEADFPQLTGPQINAKLVEWCHKGIENGAAEAIRRRGRTVADSAAQAFIDSWNA